MGDGVSGRSDLKRSRVELGIAIARTGKVCAHTRIHIHTYIHTYTQDRQCEVKWSVGEAQGAREMFHPNLHLKP